MAAVGSLEEAALRRKERLKNLRNKNKNENDSNEQKDVDNEPKEKLPR